MVPCSFLFCNSDLSYTAITSLPSGVFQVLESLRILYQSWSVSGLLEAEFAISRQLMGMNSLAYVGSNVIEGTVLETMYRMFECRPNFQKLILYQQDAFVVSSICHDWSRCLPRSSPLHQLVWSFLSKFRSSLLPCFCTFSTSNRSSYVLCSVAFTAAHIWLV